MVIEKEVNPRFENFIFDWNYKTYLLMGGYGSSKSYHIALKLILKLLKEKRKALVIREVYETIKDSCFDLFKEILEDMDLLSDDGRKRSRNKVVAKESPMKLVFPNGSTIIFKGMDKPEKLKSINGVSIVWIEEASEVKYKGYKELRGRVRHPSLSLHFILSWNPVAEENWTFKHFFIDREHETVILDPELLYAKKTLVKHGVYYHHSLPEDNLFLPQSYFDELEEMRLYDPDLYRVAKLGRYGANGTKVLPQLSRLNAKDVEKIVGSLPETSRYYGMDFGFEKSYNAVIGCAVDEATQSLYIFYEYYKNKMTDDQTAQEISNLKPVLITADCEDPKAITYYNLQGFRMRKCHKFAGSRLANTRKIKRFKHIYVSSACPNCWRELKDLTYYKDPRTDEMTYDEFNIDPHTFSALWYALDTYELADVKSRVRNSQKGAKSA
jgi:phage terminase large subunit